MESINGGRAVKYPLLYELHDDLAVWNVDESGEGETEVGDYG
jgi:hypothetical protein